MPANELPDNPSPSPWWQELPSDFHARAVSTGLEGRFRLRVRGSAGLDKVLRTGVATLVGSALAARYAKPGALADEMAGLEPYAALADEADFAAIFGAAPEAPAQITQEKRNIYSFPSTFTPLVATDYCRGSRNQTARFEHWKHSGWSKGTLIFLHGFSMDRYWVNSAMFSLKYFYRSGYDVVLYTLPFHGPRAEPLHPFSGFGLFSNGLSHFNEAMLHAVHDLRAIVSWLVADGQKVGMAGLSLGGYLTSLMATVEDRLAFAVPISPVVIPADLSLNWFPLNGAIQLALKSGRMELDALRRGTALHNPLTFPLKISPQNVFMIAGAGDRLTPPHYVKLLHEHWAGSTLNWYPGNHIMHLQQKRYLKQMRAFMDQAISS